MRVLFVSRNFFPKGVVGGAQVSVRLLASELKRQGHDVAVLSVDTQEHKGLHEPTGLPEYRLKLKNIYAAGTTTAWKKAIWHGIDRFGGLMSKDYAEVLADFRPNVINTNVMAAIGPGIWIKAAQAQVPIVHTVHDYYLMCIKSGMRRGNLNCDEPCKACRMTALGPMLGPSRKVVEVIYVSEHMKRAHFAAGLFAPETGATIIHGSYAPTKPIAPRLGSVEPGRLTIGYFGRISPEKGLDRLIKTLAKLPTDRWTLRVGGSGAPEYVRAMADLATGLPVDFLGVQKPDDFYASVDAVVVSSLWHDPAPRVAYEAGIHGVIPIVAKRGGLPELVGNGIRGLIFDPDNSDSLIEAIDRFLMQPDLLVKFQENWAAARHIFDPTTVAEQTLAVYERAIARSRNASVSP